MHVPKAFASDNQAPVPEAIVAAIAACNVEHVPSYGQDRWCKQATRLLQDAFDGGEVYFVCNGTGANVLALQACLPQRGTVLCTEVAHLHENAGGAPERLLGCKVVPLPHHLGKLTPQTLQTWLQHQPSKRLQSPTVLSLTQPTELGTLYSLDDLMELAALAKHHHIFLHLDGARLPYAAAALHCSLAALAAKPGFDAISFGGSKCGLLFGEVVIYRGKPNPMLPMWRKQLLQLTAKMRYIGAQYEAFLTDELWRTLAQAALVQAQWLAQKLITIPELTLPYPCQTNAIFLHMPRPWFRALRRQAFCYMWQEQQNLVRLMTNYDTSRQDCQIVLDTLRNCQTLERYHANKPHHDLGTL